MSDSAVMTPGTYLRKRREHARLGLRQAAATLATLPWAIRPVGTRDLARLAIRLASAEDDTAHFSVAQVQLLRNVFAFDVEIYCQLVDLHAAGPGSDLPIPQVCRHCACSWHDACLTDQGACAWAEPDLCTACLRQAVAGGELRPNVVELPRVPA